MRSRRSQQEHEQAVSRRLAQLSAELATTRGEVPEAARTVAPAAGGDWWDGHTRVAPVRAPLVVVPSPPPAPGPPEEAPPVPVPGRHAARRGRRLLAEALPETLRGRVGLGPAQVAVLAVIVALGLAATAWWVVRGDAETVSPAAPAIVAASDQLLALPVSGSAAVTTGAVAGSQTTVTVDVAGKVRRPGIAVLDAGARVVDALAAAGGARPGVDLSTLNLARVLVDGEQILVGRPAAATAPAQPGTVPTAGAGPGTLVDLNRATQAELETLPEVGPVTAAAILAWRDEHGGFSAIDELLEVDGIGDATLAQIAPHVTV